MAAKEDRRQAALDYHEFPTPGKISVTPTKQLVNQSDLALAYSPGVAAACEAIVADPLNAFRFTARGNLVGVISNGTAVLGLGAIGPLAAKPVMEGKAVLFKKFAGIDVFDIEIEQRDPYKLIEVDRRARAHLRRHQSRGHQGAGVLHRRARTAQAHEDSGVPRRPARHRHHRRRRRASTGCRWCGKDIGAGQAGGERRRRRGARLRGLAARSRAARARTSG